MDILFIIIGTLSLIVFISSSIMIYSFLQDRDAKTASFLLVDLFIFQYLSKYKSITQQEQGKIGILYYSWLVSVNLALISFVLLLAFGDIF